MESNRPNISPYSPAAPSKNIPSGYVQKVNAQIRLCICAVWSGPLLSAARITGYYRMYPWRATALTFLHIPQPCQAKIYLQGMCRKWMPRSDCASVQCDQDLYCLLPESLDTIECIHGEQLPWHFSIFPSHAKQKYTFRVCAESEHPDQTVHLCSVIRTFSVCCQNHWIL